MLLCQPQARLVALLVINLLSILPAFAADADSRPSIAESDVFSRGKKLNTNQDQRVSGPKPCKNLRINGSPCDESRPSPASALPDRQQVIAAMLLANDYFMRKWPDPSLEIRAAKTWPSNIWTRAVYYEGLMALYKVHPERSYLDYARRWADAHRWGLPRGPATRNADNQCCGQTYMELHQIEGNPDAIRDIRASVDAMVASGKADDWSWVDAIQMAMPVFAKLGLLTGDNRYFQKMYALFSFTKNSHGGSGLYNPKDHLWWRDKDFVPPYTTSSGRNCYWARGNGWVLAALVRVLDVLPAGDPHREEYETVFKEMCGALAPLQRADGFWNVSLHDPEDFGGRELTGTALFSYGMAWGVNCGLLERNRFLPVIARAWNAMADDALHGDGRLGYVQGTGKEPKDGQPVTCDSVPDFEDYGLGCFLLAGSEISRMK
jgi:rhamnogalacturonyl hydrolase YesR